MESTKLKKNFIYNILYQASIYITPLIVTPYLSRVLGVDMIGRYSFAQSIVSFFVLFATLGTTYFGQREIAIAQKMPQKRSQVFFEVIILRIVNTAFAFVVFIIAVAPNSIDPRLYLIAALEILSVGLDISWLFQGMEKFSIIALTNCIAKIVSIVLIFTFVRTDKQLNLYVLFYCGTILLGFAGQWLFIKGNIVFGFKITIKGILRTLKISMGLFIAQIAMQVYTVLDKAMIGWLTQSEVQNGFYEQAQKLIRILVVVSTSVGTVMASRVANLWGERKDSEIRDLISVSFRIVCCISLPVLFVIQLGADLFVPWFYGSGFEGVEPILRVLSVLPFIIGCSSVVGMQYFIPTGKEKYLTLSVTIGCIVNVVLNMIFIINFQAVGAAIASVIAEVTVTAIQFSLAKNNIGVKKIPSIAIRYLLYCIPMICVGLVIRLLLKELDYVIVIVIITCCIIYLLEMILFKDPLIVFFIHNKGNNK